MSTISRLVDIDCKSSISHFKNKQLKIDMEALLLSYLYLYIDDSDIGTEFGAGDLATSNLATGLAPYSAFYNSTHKLLAELYNAMVNGSLPGSTLNLPEFFIFPQENIVSPNFQKADIDAMRYYKTLNRIIPMTSQSIINYHYLWYSYLNGRSSVSVYCTDALLDCDNYDSIKNGKMVINYKLPALKRQFLEVEKLRNNTIKGVLLEGELSGHPCLDSKIINTFKIKEICGVVNSMSENSYQFLQMMKYVIQSPVYIEEDEEYSIFKHANSTVTVNGYFFKQNKV